MKQIADLINTKIPNYAYFALCAFDVPYNHLWNDKKYLNWSKSKECEFTRLKNQYSASPLTRTMIIDLFAKGKLYDGFLCTMIWGHIGANPNGKTIFQYVFDIANKNLITATIQSVIQLLQKNDLPKAYCLLNNKPTKIYGLGESFFTKLLYFAGASMGNLSPEPLIFDNNMRMAYYQMMCVLNAPVHSNTMNRYIDYCEKMEQLRKLLNLPTAGHLEAFLFCPGIRAIIF